MRENHAVSYNENGWQLTDFADKVDESGYNTYFSDFTPLGVPSTQLSKFYDKEGSFVWDNLNIYYIYYEGLRQSYISGTRTNPDGKKGAISTAVQFYDPNGNFNGQMGVDAGKGESKPAKTVYVDRTFDGMIIAKYDLYSPFNVPIYAAKWTHNFATINNQFLGCYQFGQDKTQKAIPAIIMKPPFFALSDTESREIGIDTKTVFNINYHSTASKAMSGSLYGQPSNNEQRPVHNISPFISGNTLSNHELINSPSRVEIGSMMLANYIRPITTSYPPLGPMVTTVGQGDTAQTLAQRMDLSSSAAGLLMQANGWLGDS